MNGRVILILAFEKIMKSNLNEEGSWYYKRRAKDNSQFGWPWMWTKYIVVVKFYISIRQKLNYVLFFLLSPWLSGCNIL